MIKKYSQYLRRLSSGLFFSATGQNSRTVEENAEDIVLMSFMLGMKSKTSGKRKYANRYNEYIRENVMYLVDGSKSLSVDLLQTSIVDGSLVSIISSTNLVIVCRNTKIIEKGKSYIGQTITMTLWFDNSEQHFYFKKKLEEAMRLAYSMNENGGSDRTPAHDFLITYKEGVPPSLPKSNSFKQYEMDTIDEMIYLTKKNSSICLDMKKVSIIEWRSRRGEFIGELISWNTSFTKRKKRGSGKIFTIYFLFENEFQMNSWRRDIESKLKV